MKDPLKQPYPTLRFIILLCVIQVSADVAGAVVNPPDLKLPKFTPFELVNLTFTHDIVDGKRMSQKLYVKQLWT